MRSKHHQACFQLAGLTSSLSYSAGRDGGITLYDLHLLLPSAFLPCLLPYNAHRLPSYKGPGCIPSAPHVDRPQLFRFQQHWHLQCSGPSCPSLQLSHGPGASAQPWPTSFWLPQFWCEADRAWWTAGLQPEVPADLRACRRLTAGEG